MTQTKSIQAGARTQECAGNFPEGKPDSHCQDCGRSQAAHARTQWPKFRVRRLTTGGEYETTIMERDAAEALDLKLMEAAKLDKWEEKYATPEQVKISFEQLASGSILGFEPRGSNTHFERYTQADSIRDAAPELLEALKGALEYFEGPPFIALHGDMPAKLTRVTIAKAEGK